MRAYDNERWRIADQTAAYLSVDRDVCRRAFHGESLSFISEVVESVRSWEDDPDYDPEKMIEDWAREVGAGVFDENRRGANGFTHVGDIVAHEFLRLAFKRPELNRSYDYHLYLICVRLEEDRIGRQLTTSELERFTRRFYAPNYRRDMERIPEERWNELHAELEHEDAHARKKRPPRRRAG